MNFEPQKFFIGVIDFFSIILPGALLAYFWKDCVASAMLGRPSLPLVGTEAWMIFLFMAYLLGHIAFLLGSLALDEIYDVARNSTKGSQVKRLARKRGFSNVLMRAAAYCLFGKDPDTSLNTAIRIKSQALATIQAESAVNAFQWCKARLSKQHPEGSVEVNRFEADSKFFRSFAVVLVVLAIFFSWQCRPALSLGCGVLLIPTLWRYADQRLKSTQHAYWLVITLESMETAPPINLNPRPQLKGPTRAGGVVFTESENVVKYLLVESSQNRTQLVLPKGHIEWGENEKQTAVREVLEETGCWAQVVRWIDDVRFASAPDAPLVRFFLMKLVKEDDKWPPEERQHQWVSLEEAHKLSLLDETRKLLDEADKARIKLTQKAPKAPKPAE